MGPNVEQFERDLEKFVGAETNGCKVAALSCPDGLVAVGVFVVSVEEEIV